MTSVQTDQLRWLYSPHPRDGDQHHPEESVKWTRSEMWAEHSGARVAP